MPHKIENSSEGDGSCEGAEAGSSSQNEEVLSSFTDALYAVEPLPWCPHLDSVGSVPSEGLNASAACDECEDLQENWVCLTCYKVMCGRFINKHMLRHFTDVDHPMTLSYSDLSVWCYVCESYVHNEALIPAKDSAYVSKFQEPPPSTLSSGAR